MIRATCSSCRARFALGLLCCPHCKQVAPQYAANVKKEESVPHTTVTDGPSNAGAAPGEIGYIERAEHKVAEAVAGLRDERAPELSLPGWASKTVAHLRKAAGERGLDTAGPKASLAARLAEHDAMQAAAVPAEAEPEEIPA